MVELVRSGRRAAELAGEFGCHDTSIRAWVRQANADERGGKPDAPLTSAERQEPAQLRRPLRQITRERDILAQGYGRVCQPGQRHRQNMYAPIQANQADLPTQAMCKHLKAYAPLVLLKIVLLAYSRGIVSSRTISRACLQNVLFMATSSDTQPDHSTLTVFVSGMGDVVAQLFVRVLVVCDRQGLIGRELFAIDGHEPASGC